MALPELKVRVGHDDKALRKGLSRSEARLQQFAAVASSAAKAMGTAFVAASGVAVVGLAKVLKEADKIAKSAQKMGLATQELQRLEHAAGLAGAEFGTLRSGINLLNRNLAMTASGQGAEAQRAFQALGIEVKNTDGSMKSASAVLDEIADKFAGFEDGVNKSALALTIFGRSGSDLIPLLNQGSQAVQESKDELADLGAVMSNQLMKNSERLNDNMSRMRTAAFGVAVALGEKLVPILVNVTDKIIEWIKRNQATIAIGQRLADMFIYLGGTAARGADLILNSFQAAYEDLKFLWTNFPTVVGAATIGAVNLAIGAINKLISSAKSGLNSIVEAANSVLPKFAQINPLDVDADTISKMTNPYAAKLEKPLVEHAERIGKIMAQRTLAGLADADPSAMAPGEGEAGRTQAPGFTKDNSKEMEALRERLAGRLAVIRESFMTESELSAEFRDQDLATLQSALENKLLTEQQHRSMVEQLEARHQKTLQDIRDRGNHAMLSGAGEVLGSLRKRLG
jgi:hypothetical protein